MTNPNIKELKLANKPPVKYLKMGKSTGERALRAAGWQSCRNPNYLTRNGQYAHYNVVMRVWIIS